MGDPLRGTHGDTPGADQSRNAMRRFLLGVGALAALLLAACSPADEAASGPAVYAGPPKPALWKIADADTTLYLFGTIHLLPPGLDWETPAFKQAFTDASTLYLEADTNLPRRRSPPSSSASACCLPTGASPTCSIPPSRRPCAPLASALAFPPSPSTGCAPGTPAS
jgi:hypothetical protein